MGILIQTLNTCVLVDLLFLAKSKKQIKMDNCNCSVSADCSDRYRKKMSKQIKRTDCFDVEVSGKKCRLKLIRRDIRVQIVLVNVIVQPFFYTGNVYWAV